MKNIIKIMLLSLVTVLSCNNLCNDCKPTSTSQYFVVNKLNANIECVFYGDSNTNFSKDTLILKSNDRLSMFYFATGSPGSSSLDFDYHLCDSLIISSSGMKKFKSLGIDECNSWHNILCTSNYTVIIEEEIKKGKNKGGKNIEYELILK